MGDASISARSCGFRQAEPWSATPYEALSGFSSQGTLSKSRCELQAFDMAREVSEETAEQEEDAAMLRIDILFWWWDIEVAGRAFGQIISQLSCCADISNGKSKSPK